MLQHQRASIATCQRAQRSKFAIPTPRSKTRCRAETVSGEAYEDIIDALAQRAINRATAAAASSGRLRVVVGVAGAPGSGKSTLAAAVVARINDLQSRPSGSAALQKAAGQGAAAKPAAADPLAVVLPMDGFHYYRRELDAMPDPKEAHARRGAPWTFDAAKFLAAVRQVRDAAGSGRTVRVPSFDHGVGDPVEDDIVIPAGAAVVLVEGNYVLLDSEPWCQLAGLFDEAWFVDCPLDVAMDRVFARQTAIGLAPEVSRVRIATNDRPNAELVAASASRASVLVPSTVPFRRRG